MKLKISAHGYLRFYAARIRRRSSFLLLFSLMIISAAAVYGKTPAQYREDVKRARISIESLIYADAEEMSAAEYKDYARQSLAEIRRSVPAREKIDWQAASVETDNQWLFDKLNEFEKQSENSPKRAEILTETSERLAAIEQKLSELENPAASEPAKDDDKRKLGEILRREEYVKPEKQGESLFEKTWRRFKKWLREIFPDSAPAPASENGFQSLTFILQLMLYVFVLAAVGFLIYRFAPFFAEKFKRREKKEKTERIILGEKLAGDATAQNLFDEAEQMARGGNLRGAIRKTYIALLCELDDRKIIGLARHKTNRDYLRDVRNKREIYENMNGLTVDFERHWYGFEPVNEMDWNEFKDGYKKVMSS